MEVTEYKRGKDQPSLLTDEIIESINTQVIWWSDDREEHYFMDYSIDGIWIASHTITNDLNNCVVEIWESKHGC